MNSMMKLNELKKSFKGSEMSPAIITQQMIWEKLEKLELLVQHVVKREIENNIEEISVGAAARRMHVSRQRVIQLIKEGILPARKYKRADGEGYRVRVCDIHKFQTGEQIEDAQPIKPPLRRSKQFQIHQLINEFHRELKTKGMKGAIKNG